MKQAFECLLCQACGYDAEHSSNGEGNGEHGIWMESLVGAYHAKFHWPC